MKGLNLTLVKESSAHWHNMLMEMLLTTSSIYIFITWLCELKLQEAFIKCNYCRISNRGQLLLRVASKESFVHAYAVIFNTQVLNHCASFWRGLFLNSDTVLCWIQKRSLDRAAGSCPIPDSPSAASTAQSCQVLGSQVRCCVVVMTLYLPASTKLSCFSFVVTLSSINTLFLKTHLCGFPFAWLVGWKDSCSKMIHQSKTDC